MHISEEIGEHAISKEQEDGTRARRSEYRHLIGRM
jgi:hypothetical protein